MRVRFVRCAQLVQMRVDVLPRAVLVRVKMQRSALNDFPQNIQSEQNEHYADAEFQHSLGLLADLKIEQQHENSGNHQRNRMSQTPDAADEHRTQQAFAFVDNRRNRRQMVSFGRVFESD